MRAEIVGRTSTEDTRAGLFLGMQHLPHQVQERGRTEKTQYSHSYQCRVKIHLRALRPQLQAKSRPADSHEENSHVAVADMSLLRQSGQGREESRVAASGAKRRVQVRVLVPPVPQKVPPQKQTRQSFVIAQERLQVREMRQRICRLARAQEPSAFQTRSDDYFHLHSVSQKVHVNQQFSSARAHARRYTTIQVRHLRRGLHAAFQFAETQKKSSRTVATVHRAASADSRSCEMLPPKS